MDASTFLALTLACAPQVHADTAHALVSVESAFNPWAIGVVGGALQRQPRHRTEAIATAQALQAAGRNFSVGLGQINVGNFPRLGLNTHATDCPSYEPPTEFSGLGQLLGSAIVENPATGETTLKLNFSMSKLPGRSASPAAASTSSSSSVVTQGHKLSLRALLHYLWDQAELTHWKPGFGGRRSWFTVRKHLLRAAEKKFIKGHTLKASLYIPEVFSVDQRDALHLRRTQQWARATHQEGFPQYLMLMIAEVKEITSTRFGHKAAIKHIPDQAFMLDEQLYRRMGRRFASVLSLWGACEDLHMVIFATFSLTATGIPNVVELFLMPVTQHWLPIESGFEKQLLDQLASDGRSFVKGLRYDISLSSAWASTTLTDCEDSAPVLFIADEGVEHSGGAPTVSDPSTPVWVWNPSSETMPMLPPRRQRSSRVADSMGDPRLAGPFLRSHCDGINPRSFI